jgi:tetratricopeptide (TPR) repeat protein
MHSFRRNIKTETAPHPLLMVATALSLLGLILIPVGCSSAPDTPEHVVARKNQAARYAEFGNAQFNQGNYDLALRYFDLALTENVAVDNLPGIAQSYNSIGRVYSITGNQAEARTNFLTAIQFADLAENPEHRMQAHVNLGVVALQTGDTSTALEFFQLAQEAIDADQARPSAVLYHSMGTLYARQDQFDRAREQLERAREINEKAGEWTELAGNHYMLASVASRQERFDEAYREANRALEYDKRAENSPGIASDLHALGTISERRGNHDDAYQYYLRSLRIYLALNQARPAAELLGRLEEVARRTGREEEAAGFRNERERIEAAINTSGARLP